MPHLDLTREQLDIPHRSLIAPDDEQLDDLANDLHDVVYQKGLAVADEIRSETSLQGHVRRPLLARLQEQQQKNLRRKAGRARTSRPLGGGVAREALTSTLTATVPTTTTTTNGQTDGTTEEQEVRVGAEVRAAEVDGRAKGEDKENAEMKFDGQVRHVEQMPRSDGQSNVVGRIQSLLPCACVVQTAPPF